MGIESVIAQHTRCGIAPHPARTTCDNGLAFCDAMQALEQFIKRDVLGPLDMPTRIFLPCAHVDDHRTASEKPRDVHFGS